MTTLHPSFVSWSEAEIASVLREFESLWRDRILLQTNDELSEQALSCSVEVYDAF